MNKSITQTCQNLSAERQSDFIDVINATDRLLSIWMNVWVKI